MKRYVKLLLVIVCITSLIKLFLVICFDKNIYHEEDKTVIGKIVSVQKANDKVTVDVKNRQLYRLTIYDSFNYELGDVIKVSGKFVTPSSNTVFNLFNYRQYLLSKNIKSIATINEVKLVSVNKNLFYALKNRMIRRANKLKTKGYVKAFLLGDLQDVQTDAKESYQTIGVNHLFAVSGMHVNVLLLVLNHLLKKVKFKDLLLFLTLILFMFLTNFPASLMRCVLFLTLNYFNKTLKLGISLPTLVVITALILLLYNPYLVFNVGFLFSVTITFYLTLSGKMLKNKKGYFRKLFWTSLICFLASVPLLANYFFKVNFLSPLYNMFFIPAVSVVVFPLSIISFVMPFIDNLLMPLTGVIEKAAVLFSSFNWFTFIISKPGLIVTGLYYIVLFLALKLNYRYVIIFFIIMLININSRLLIVNPELVFIDVNQGDCSVIILPGGNVVMVDTGGKAFGDFSLAKKRIIPYLNSRGINEIECLILTHGDYDHAGEASTLVKEIAVKKIIINNGGLNDVEKDLSKVYPVSKVTDKYVYGKYVFKFLNNNVYDDENKNSIVTYFKIRGANVIMMADADKTVEKDIISKYNLPKMDILKVGHHGSKTSSAKEFINVINPAYAVISVGSNNKFGHPDDKTLSTLKNATVLRTDKDGSIRFVFRRNMVNKYYCKPYIIVER